MLRLQIGFPLPTVDLNQAITVKNIFTLSECESLIKITDNKYPNNYLSFEEINEILPIFSNKISSLISDANSRFFEFEITDITGVSIINNAFENNFDWNSDIGNDEFTSTRKITMMIFLSDNSYYEGGNFLGFPDRIFLSPPSGTAIIFPSFMVYKFDKVLKGNQKVLLCWACGHPFR